MTFHYPREIIDLIIKGKLKPGISSEILFEIKNVLKRKKNHLSDNIISMFVQEIENLSKIVFPKRKVNIILKDPDDNRIVECALTFNADYIISGDKYLLDLKEYQHIPILSPTVFLKKFFIE